MLPPLLYVLRLQFFIYYLPIYSFTVKCLPMCLPLFIIPSYCLPFAYLPGTIYPFTDFIHFAITNVPIYQLPYHPLPIYKLRYHPLSIYDFLIYQLPYHPLPIYDSLIYHSTYRREWNRRRRHTWLLLSPLGVVYMWCIVSTLNHGPREQRSDRTVLAHPSHPCLSSCWRWWCYPASAAFESPPIDLESTRSSISRPVFCANMSALFVRIPCRDCSTGFAPCSAPTGTKPRSQSSARAPHNTH